MRPTALDVASAISAALCEACRPNGGRVLCEECQALRDEVQERLRTGIHPDALAAFASRVLSARSGRGKSKRRGGTTKREVSEHMRTLVLKRWGRRPKPGTTH